MCLLYSLIPSNFPIFFQHVSKFLIKDPKKEQTRFLLSFLLAVKWLHGTSFYWTELTAAVSQWLN